MGSEGARHLPAAGLDGRAAALDVPFISLQPPSQELTSASPVAKQPTEDPKFTFFQENTKRNNFLCSCYPETLASEAGRFMGWSRLPVPACAVGSPSLRGPGTRDNEVFTL